MFKTVERFTVFLFEIIPLRIFQNQNEEKEIIPWRDNLIDISIGWIIVGVFVCAIIAISMQPIAGGSAIAYSMLFAQMGIPKEAVAIALALDTMMDYIITGFEGLAVKMTLATVAKNMGMMDEEKLRSISCTSIIVAV